MVGEPTSVNTLAINSKMAAEALYLSVTISMPQKHVAYTPMNQNPGHAMAQLISSLQTAMAQTPIISSTQHACCQLDYNPF